MTVRSIVVYRHWIRRFVEYCRSRRLDIHSQLTLAGVRTFARWYSRKHQVQAQRTFWMARSAMSTWALALKTLGETLPEWSEPTAPPPRHSPLLTEFAQHLHEVRGNLPRTIHKKIQDIQGFIASIGPRRRPQDVRLDDIDAYLVRCRKRYARVTAAGIGSSIRSFMRFLLATGRTKMDLAPLVTAPVVRRAERPHRAMPWEDVQRILTSIDRSTVSGRRDYALLLMMSVYGMGAGEVIHLTVDDVDWRAQTLHVVRPKTGAEFSLPLLPVVARALSSYLRDGRPAHAQTRHVFLRRRAPFKGFNEAGAIRGILHRRARQAGVTAPFMGTHVLRHTHACRQMDLGASPKVIGDILGHRDPDSTSAYLRVPTERLREMALAVPR